MSTWVPNLCSELLTQAVPALRNVSSERFRQEKVKPAFPCCSALWILCNTNVCVAGQQQGRAGAAADVTKRGETALPRGGGQPGVPRSGGWLPGICSAFPITLDNHQQPWPGFDPHGALAAAELGRLVGSTSGPGPSLLLAGGAGAVRGTGRLSPPWETCRAPLCFWGAPVVTSGGHSLPWGCCFICHITGEVGSGLILSSALLPGCGGAWDTPGLGSSGAVPGWTQQPASLGDPRGCSRVSQLPHKQQFLGMRKSCPG